MGTCRLIWQKNKAQRKAAPVQSCKVTRWSKRHNTLLRLRMGHSSTRPEIMHTPDLRLVFFSRALLGNQGPAQQGNPVGTWWWNLSCGARRARPDVSLDDSSCASHPQPGVSFGFLSLFRSFCICLSIKPRLSESRPQRPGIRVRSPWFS